MHMCGYDSVPYGCMCMHVSVSVWVLDSVCVCVPYYSLIEWAEQSIADVPNVHIVM